MINKNFKLEKDKQKFFNSIFLKTKLFIRLIY